MTDRATTSRRHVLLAGLAGTAALAGARPARADILADVRKRGALLCATEMEYPPFDWLTGTEFTGVDRDLLDVIGPELGVPVKFLDLAWTSLLPGLEAKKFDLVTAPVLITPERLTRYAFTVPIAEATTTLMKRADDTSIARPEDVAGKTVGGPKATLPIAQLTEWAKSLRKPVTIVEFADHEAAAADLAAGKIDAMVNSLPNIAYSVTRQPKTFALVLPPFGKPAWYGWAGRKDGDDRSLVDAVSAALLKMQDDGRMATLQTKWFGQTFALPRTVPTPAA